MGSLGFKSRKHSLSCRGTNSWTALRCVTVLLNFVFLLPTFRHMDGYFLLCLMCMASMGFREANLVGSSSLIVKVVVP